MFRKSIAISNNISIQDIVYYPQIDAVAYRYVFNSGTIPSFISVSKLRLFSRMFKVDGSELEQKLCSNNREAHTMALSKIKI